MTVIYVDADACPVKAEVIKIAERHQVQAVFVSNAGVRTGNHPLLRSILVPDGPDVADDWIAERSGPCDVVITSDIPLAARCLENGSSVLGPQGRPFTEQSIGGALAGRELNRHLRELGVETGGPSGQSSKDKSRFLDGLDRMVRAAAS